MTLPALSPKQQLAIAQSTGRVNVYDGSVRAGKTFASLIRWLTIMAEPPAGGEHIVIGKNLDAIYRNIFSPFKSEPALSWAEPFIHYRQGATTGTVLGRRIHVVGANDIQAADKIQGMTVATAYTDEITILQESMFTMLLSRMSPPGASLIGTTNPDSPRHWLMTKYLDRLEALTGWRYFHFTMDDNLALTEEYKDALKAEYTGIWYDRFILGKWTVAEGAIFPQWDPKTHVVEPDQIPPIVDLISVAVDYGTTNATAALALALAEDGRLYFIDEWRVDQGTRHRPQTDAELSTGLIAWLNTLPGRPRFTIVDPSAASFRAQLLQDGIPTTAGNNSVNDGLRTIASLLASDSLRVASTCTGLINEIPGYVWDAKHAEKGKDVPVQRDDHSIDAGRYAIYTTRAIWQSLINPATSQGSPHAIA